MGVKREQLHQWFLEVKRWLLPLTEKEANQTVGYAFSQGTRWAVLTNGDEWRIYDAHSKAPLPQKCIMTIQSLSSPDATEVFSLLSKDSIQREQLAASYRVRLIYQSVQSELLNQESATVKMIRKTIDCPTIPNVTKSEVTDAITLLLAPSPSVKVKQMITTGGVEGTEKLPLALGEVYSINELYESTCTGNFPVSGRKPEYISFSDGSGENVANWREFTGVAIEWLLQKYGIPAMPISTGSTEHASVNTAAGIRYCYFMNNEPIHSDGMKFHSIREFSIQGKVVYANLHNNAWGFVRCIYRLMQAIGADPLSMTVRLKPQL